MSAGIHRAEAWLLRAALFVGLLSAVVTVIYLTPFPDFLLASCDRPCHELDWPMICRFRLTLEQQHSLGAMCGDCPRNVSHCFREGCVIGEGNSRKILTANRQLPGPTIQVCQNDILVVDVVNRLPGQAVTIHWRGQSQSDSPYMDGVPMVTQCPISSYTTFQYKFRAAQPGTHLWHSHTGNEKLDGIFGALIVRQADRIDTQRPLYDIDDPHHVLIINEWNSNKHEILINGIASSGLKLNKESLLPKIIINSGLKYRIRVAYAGVGISCPLSISIDDHLLNVITLDGKSIVPILTKNVNIAQGERVDFVLNANKSNGNFLIKVVSNCTDAIGHAKLIYNTTTEEKIKTSEEVINNSVINTLSTTYVPSCSSLDSSTVCLNNVHSVKKMPSSLSNEKVDMRLYLPFDYIKLSEKSNPAEAIPRINNVTFIFPSSPLVSQYDDLSYQDLICKNNLPARCESSPVCECAHIIEIPLNSRVELILVNKVTSNQHVFHMHGYTFHVVGITNDIPVVMEDLKKLDQKGILMKRNLIDPVIKDTIAVPNNGAVALRFIANNPGFWLLHDQSSSEFANGLDVVLQVGKTSDLPPVPENFPKCGSWVGPEFFLI